MMRVVEDKFDARQLARARTRNNGLAERMIDAEKMSVAGTTRKLIKPGRNAGAANPLGQRVKPERGRINEVRSPVQFMLGEPHQLLLKLMKVQICVGVTDFQLFPHLVVEIFQ